MTLNILTGDGSGELLHLGTTQLWDCNGRELRGSQCPHPGIKKGKYMNETGRDITMKGDEKGQKFPPETWSVTVVDGETPRFGRTMRHSVVNVVRETLVFCQKIFCEMPVCRFLWCFLFVFATFNAKLTCHNRGDGFVTFLIPQIQGLPADT